MKELEASGRSVEDALAQALLEMGVGRDQVEVQIIKKGRAGLFGMGFEEAKIKVKLRDGPAPTEAAPALPPPEVNEPAALAETALGEKPVSGGPVKASDFAVVVLSDLLKLMKMRAHVEVAPATPEAPMALNIQGEDLGVLIGRRGQTLASLQYIVRIMVSERAGKWLPITIDVAGYKQRRREALQRLAIGLAEQVKLTRRPAIMEVMPADERRIVHMTLADNADVMTQSTGEGEARRVVIQLKKL